MLKNHALTGFFYLAWNLKSRFGRFFYQAWNLKSRFGRFFYQVWSLNHALADFFLPSVEFENRVFGRFYA